MERNQFTFYRSYYEAVKELPKKEQSAVMLAICAYALDEEEPVLTGTAKAIFSLVRPTLDASRRKAASGKAGGERKQTGSKAEANNKQTPREKENKNKNKKENECYNPQTPKRVKFVPPTVDEVSAYCRERGNSVDPQAFIDFYESKGWMVGKNAMKDWKASVRTWEKGSTGKPKSPNNMVGVDFQPDSERIRRNNARLDEILRMTGQEDLAERLGVEHGE